MRALLAILVLALALAAWLLLRDPAPNLEGPPRTEIERQAAPPPTATPPQDAAPPPAEAAANRAHQEAIQLNERALDLLKQGDAAAAEELLAQACALASDDRILSANLSRTRVRLGRVAAESGRAQEALEWFRAAAAADADEGAPAEWEASFQLRRGERDEARSVVLAALENFPAAAGLLRLRGEIAFLEGDLDVAVESYAAAARTDGSESTRARLAQLEEERRAFSHYLTDATAHCDSRYDPEDAPLVARMPALHAELERAWQEVVNLLGVQPQDRLLVLWLSPRRYLGTAPEWSSGLYDGRVRVLVREGSEVDEALRATVRHELTHAVLHTLDGQLPTWLHEGLAQRSEGRKVEPARARLTGRDLSVDAAALASDWTGWTDAERLGEAYAIALSFVTWIEERYGTGAVPNLLHGLTQSDFDTAWIRVFARSLAELESEHRNWLRSGS
jgi:tetratricopeptide (TPR) repeat protein